MIEDLIARLGAGTVVALGDLHTNSDARLLTEALLENGAVTTLFIEFPNQTAQHAATAEQYGVALNDALAAMRNADVARDAASLALQTGGYFHGLAMGDAAPTLIQLAATAVSRGVRVAACDLDAAEALNRITQLRAIENYPHAPTAITLFQDEGFAVRDDYAMRQIDRHTTARAGRLILGGDAHFADYENRYIRPHGQAGVDVLPNNLAAKLRTTRSVYDVFVVRNAQIGNYL